DRRMARPVPSLLGAAARCTAHRGGPWKTRTKESHMTGNTRSSTPILGSLRSADGVGVMRIEDRYDTVIEDLWSAITDPDRHARWHGQVEGDLRPGGEFRIYIEADDIEQTGRVETCEPPRRLVVTTRETDETYQRGQGVPPFDEVTEVTLTADGDQIV